MAERPDAPGKSASAVVGKPGGRAASHDGRVVIDFPPDAVVEDVTVSITRRATKEVLPPDPETGETAARPITDVIVHGGAHTIVDITFSDSSITATDGHPFWDVTTGAFTNAIDLRPDDRVLTATGGTVAVVGIDAYETQTTVYNLTVDDIHTYYAGDTPVLVHNSCGDEVAHLLARVDEIHGALGHPAAMHGRVTALDLPPIFGPRIMRVRPGLTAARAGVS
jgi:hypothetical protein